MSLQGGQESASLVENEPFIDDRNARVEGVSVDSTCVDSTNTPTTQLRRGLVVGYDSAGKNYVDANDSLVDAHTYSSLTSAEAPDGDWEGETILVTIPGQGSVTHTLGSHTTVTNLASAILDINGSAAIGSLVQASASGANILLTAIQPGVVLEITPSLATAFAGGAAVQSNSSGSLNKFGILYDPIVSMLGFGGVVSDKKASIVTANAIVRESDLFELNSAARLAFAANGIRLV